MLVTSLPGHGIIVDDFLYSIEGNIISVKVFLEPFRSVSGLKLVTGPLGLPGFCKGVMIPSPIESM